MCDTVLMCKIEPFIPDLLCHVGNYDKNFYDISLQFELHLNIIYIFVYWFLLWHFVITSKTFRRVIYWLNRQKYELK